MCASDEPVVLKHPSLNCTGRKRRSSFVGNHVSVTHGPSVTSHSKEGLRDCHLMWALMPTLLTRLP